MEHSVLLLCAGLERTIGKQLLLEEGSGRAMPDEVEEEVGPESAMSCRLQSGMNL